MDEEKLKKWMVEKEPEGIEVVLAPVWATAAPITPKFPSGSVNKDESDSGEEDEDNMDHKHGTKNAKWYEGAGTDMKFVPADLTPEQEKLREQLLAKHAACFTRNDKTDMYGQVDKLYEVKLPMKADFVPKKLKGYKIKETLEIKMREAIQIQ